MDKSAQHSVALVTGASRGIGRAIAIKLAELNYGLVLTGRDGEALAQTAAQCHQPGAKVHTYALDVTDYDAVDKMLEEISQ